jgi:hypothetical protein
MVNSVSLPKELGEHVWAEVEEYANDVENLIVSASKLIVVLHQLMA